MNRLIRTKESKFTRISYSSNVIHVLGEKISTLGLQRDVAGKLNLDIITESFVSWRNSFSLNRRK